MEGANQIIPKEDNAYFSLRHEAGIRREIIPSDMIH
jgi:hypothetical protein